MPFVFLIQMYVFKVICGSQGSDLYDSADFSDPSVRRSFSLEHFGGRSLTPDQWETLQNVASFAIGSSEFFCLLTASLLFRWFESSIYDQYLYEWVIQFFCGLLNMSEDEVLPIKSTINKDGVEVPLSEEEVHQARVTGSKALFFFAGFWVVGATVLFFYFK